MNVVKLLIENGANVDATNAHNISALMLATSLGESNFEQRVQIKATHRVKHFPIKEITITVKWNGKSFQH